MSNGNNPSVDPDLLRGLQENADLFDGELKAAFTDLLNSQSFRKKVVDLINENINIPIIGERTEGRLFGQAYDWVALAIIAALDRVD